MMSGRFTPAAATLISTSSAPIDGTGRSTGVRTSGPPGSRIATAIIWSTITGPPSCAERCARRRALEHQPCERTPEAEANDHTAGDGAAGGDPQPLEHEHDRADQVHGREWRGRAVKLLQEVPAFMRPFREQQGAAQDTADRRAHRD